MQLQILWWTTSDSLQDYQRIHNCALILKSLFVEMSCLMGCKHMLAFLSGGSRKNLVSMLEVIPTCGSEAKKCLLVSVKTVYLGCRMWVVYWGLQIQEEP